VYQLEPISKTPINVILNGAKRSEESMTIMHCESTRLQCRGCFAALSMTLTNAILIETIFEMASRSYLKKMSHRPSMHSPALRAGECMTFTRAFYIETIIEMPSSYNGASVLRATYFRRSIFFV